MWKTERRAGKSSWSTAFRKRSISAGSVEDRLPRSVSVVVPVLRAFPPKFQRDSSARMRPQNFRKAESARTMAAGSWSSPIGQPEPSLGRPSMSVSGPMPSSSMSAVLTVARWQLACITKIGLVVETRSRWRATRRSPG
jgi:hypothetical protein